MYNALSPSPVQYKKGRHGLQYMGQTNTTRNGKVCWPWTFLVRQLRSERIRVDNFPDADAQEALNYCRNLNNDRHGPWCYYYSYDKWND